MKRHVFVLFLLVLSLGMRAPARAASTKVDLLRSALRPECVQFEADHRIAGDNRLVLIVGESHANVAGQQHLAELLQRLLDEKQVQAILIEGSEGPIEIRELLRELSKHLSPDALASYWRRQLAWGQLAGWEYVALTRPLTKAYGVEDMAAKFRYAIQSVNGSEDELKRDVESAGRGADRLEQALGAMEPTGVALPDAHAVLAHHRDAIKDLTEAAQRFGEKRKPFVTKQIELLEAGLELEKLLKDTGLAALRGQKDVEGRSEEIVLRLRRDQPQAYTRLGELMAKSKALPPELETLKREAEPAAKDLAARQSAVQSSYFALANRLRAAAEAQWDTPAARPVTVNESLRQVETFFADELALERKEEPARSHTQLADRDRAMAANTEQYMRTTGARRVVLIVGAAHLEGIAENLQRLGLPFVRTRLLPQEGEEPWEVRAWERRRVPFPVVLTPDDLKESTRLQDPVWRKEQVERVQIWGAASVGLAPPVRRKKKGDVQVLYRSSDLADERFSRGEHVVDYGPVPGHPDEIFEAWNRTLGSSLTSELSDKIVQYAYGYYDVDDQKRRDYRITTSEGDHSLSEFLRAVPGKESSQIPTYVVLLHEPDVRPENGVPRSHFWYTARRPSPAVNIPGRVKSRAAEPEHGSNTGVQPMGDQPVKSDRQSPVTAAGAGGGGGRKDGNGPGTSVWDEGGGDKDGGDDVGGNDNGGDPSDGRWTAFGFAKDPRRPVLLRTTDVRRSRENLATLDHQKPIEPTEVALLKDAQEMEGLKFTEDDGTYAGMVILLAQNVEEFRAAVSRAAVLKKLVHKQVALITCGDLHNKTAELRESLFAGGAVMVWTPDRQLTPQAGEKLLAQIGETLKDRNKPRNINELLNRSIEELLRAHPDDPELKNLWESGAWVKLQPADWQVLPTLERQEEEGS
jgi:hypothetical protein